MHIGRRLIAWLVVAVALLAGSDVSATVGVGVRIGAQGAQSSGIAAPTVTAISPPFGTASGGTAVTITGTGFQGGTGLSGVTIGGTTVTGLSVSSNTTATATTAASSVSNADVVATGPGGTGTLSQGFTYMPASGWTLALYGESGVTLNSTTVSAWADKSGAGDNFSQATGAKQPTWSASGLGTGRGSMSFASTQTLQGGAISTIIGPLGSLTPYSVYVVCSPSSARAGAAESYDSMFADTGGYFTFGVTSTNSNSVVLNTFHASDQSVFTGGGLTFSAAILASAIYDGTTKKVAINSGGSFSGSAAQGDVAVISNTAQIGTSGNGAANQNFQGQVGAVFAWNVALSAGNDTVVRTFFKNYYSIPAW